MSKKNWCVECPYYKTECQNPSNLVSEAEPECTKRLALDWNKTCEPFRRLLAKRKRP